MAVRKRVNYSPYVSHLDPNNASDLDTIHLIIAAIDRYEEAYYNWDSINEKTNEWISFVDKLKNLEKALSEYLLTCQSANIIFSEGCTFDDDSYLGKTELENLLSVTEYSTRMSALVIDTEEKVRLLRVDLYVAWKKFRKEDENMFNFHKQYPRYQDVPKNWKTGIYDELIVDIN